MSVSQNDIAKAAGVSQRAVSYALNGKPNVKKEKRDEILRVARQMGYRVNSSARAMRKQSTGAIGVLAQHYNIGNAFLQGINHRLQETGYHTIIEQFAGVLPLNDMPCRMVMENVVDGLIVINSDATIIDLIQNKFSGLMNQTVWLESSYFAEFGCIRRDENAVCAKAITHLVEAGFERVVYVGYSEIANNPNEMEVKFDKDKPYFGGIHYSSYQRYTGIKTSCETHGIEFVSVGSNVHQVPIAPWALADSVNQNKGRKTVVIPYDYRMTEWVFRQLAMLGVLCPRDYGLLSLDEMRTFQQQQFWPELSRITFDRFRTGELSAQMVLDMTLHKSPVKSVCITGDLIEGQTLKI